MELNPILVMVAFVVLIAVAVMAGIALIVARFYRKVDQGQALIINRMSAEPEVTFTGGVVYPIIHRSEVMDISVKSIVISRGGKEGLICADNIRADIKVAFFVRVNKTREDVLKVAQAIGCARASRQDTLEELFAAKFSEALKTVGKQLEFEQLYTRRDEFKDRIIEVIGRDLNGYALEDVAIDYLEQTPIEALDKDNILDAQGIRKITLITAEQNMSTNQLRQNEKKELTRQNLEADEAILELSRRRADAEARQKREIATIQAREQAETAKVQSEEKQRSELARIKAEEEVQVQELNKQRQVEVAGKDKERVLAIKAEHVERDRAIEVIARKREVERQEIDKEMELEVKRKEIADVVRTRIAVDRNVAEEEERIKDLRTLAEANREKQAHVIEATGEAEQELVKTIKRAEADEKVAEHKARERLTLANADLEAADRVARAKVRVAEGVQAESAAEGLAKVRVREADALALEKEGLAKARVEAETLAVRAKNAEETQNVALRVREKGVEIDARAGEVEATNLQRKLTAEAQGHEAAAKATEAQGLAEARALEAKGLAEAKALEERLRVEAAGLGQRLEALHKMDDHARQLEEMRIRFEYEQKLATALMETQKAMGESQAKVLAAALGDAHIQLMGGDGQFFDRIAQATTMGKVLETFLEQSGTARGLLGKVLGAAPEGHKEGNG